MIEINSTFMSTFNHLVLKPSKSNPWWWVQSTEALCSRFIVFITRPTTPLSQRGCSTKRLQASKIENTTTTKTPIIFFSSKQNIKHIQFFPSQLLCFWSFRQPHWSGGSCCLRCKQRLQRPVKDLFKADSVVKVSGGYFANVMPPLLLQNLSSSHKLRVLYVWNLCSSFASDEIPHGQRIKGKQSNPQLW